MSVSANQIFPVHYKVTLVNYTCSMNFLDEDGNNLWPDLLNFMFNAANSPNFDLRECALLLFKYVILAICVGHSV